ncbi:MAG: site-specific DNA-methyltransferase [Cytophagaceae bacterium]|nr:MAG: site-specific DNA-methyltransferase [Cytophagaceae bacterium]
MARTCIKCDGPMVKHFRHKLMCGDSTDASVVQKLMAGEKADMVFTDPPYNQASHTSGFARNSNNKQMSVLMDSSWDKDFIFSKSGETLLANLAQDATVYVTTSHFLAPSIWEWMATWAGHHSYCVWAKTNPMPSLAKRHWTWSTELVCYATRGKHTFNFPEEGHALSVWTISKVAKCDLHPTMKPVAVPQKAIEHSSLPGHLVMDLFGGAGSTLIACHLTKRRGRLCEIDPRYVDVIVKRYEQLTGEKAKRLGDAE